ncbi:MAG: tetratricopeptide repeat protein, partial [Kiritimatiellae bacterium]|nr:tetratricopeptide repeat protein [Kiritimatiellia bacterium]
HNQALKTIVACSQKHGDVPGHVAAMKTLAADATTVPFDRITMKLAVANLQQKEGFDILKNLLDKEDSGEEAAAEEKKAVGQNIVRAIQTFQEVVKEADAFVAEAKNPAEKRKKIAEHAETAAFLIGDCWQKLKFPIGKMSAEDFRKRAVAAFEAYAQKYPKGKYTPVVLSKIAIIHTANKEMDKAQAAMERLQKDFPDSNEAKNSVPSLAKNLMEMGLRQEAAQQYKLMLTAGGSYTTGQYLAAAEALLEARAWDLADTAFKKTIELANKGTNNVNYYIGRSTMGLAQAAYGAKRFADAHEKVKEFLEDDRFSKNALVPKAYELLMTIASDEGRTEKDDERRTQLFNEAVTAVKKLRGFNTAKIAAFKNKPAEELTDEQKELKKDVLLKDAAFDLEVSRIMFDRVAAEEAMNLVDQAKETRAKSVAGGLAFLMAHEVNSEHPFDEMSKKEQDLLERGCGLILPEMAKLGKDHAEDVVQYAEMYLQCFPDGPHKRDVQNALASAKADL